MNVRAHAGGLLQHSTSCVFRVGREVMSHYLLGRSIWACLLLALLAARES